MRTVEDLVNDEFHYELETIKTTKEQFASQIFDGFRLMQLSEKLFLEKEAEIKISKGCGKLPSDFYKEREAGPDMHCCYWIEAAGNSVDTCDQTVAFNIKMCEVTTNIQHGKLKILYYGIYTDDRGLPLVPENHGIDIAIKAYLRFINSKARYYAGEVGIERYQTAQSSYIQLFSHVRGDAKMPPPGGYRRITRILNR